LRRWPHFRQITERFYSDTLRFTNRSVNAFSLDLGAEEADRSKPNNVLTQEAFEGDVSNALVERMVACQRHLLDFGGSRRFWPANLQGRWNGDYKAGLGQRLP
jgi:hypothetical protein